LGGRLLLQAAAPPQRRARGPARGPRRPRRLERIGLRPRLERRRTSCRTRSRTRSAAARARVAASALGSVRPPPLPAAPAVPAVSARAGYRSLAATPEAIRPSVPPVLAWPRSTLSVRQARFAYLRPPVAPA